MLVVLDEASGIDDRINQVLDGALASPGARELQIGNPNRNSGFFAMTHKHLGHLYTLLHFKSAESPLCDPQFRPRMVKKFGEDSDVVRVRCDGEFPKAEADTLIPLEYADAALHRQLPELIGSQPLRLGIDCAWSGEDRTAYVLCRGPVIPYLETQTKTEPMAIVGRAVQLIRQWGGWTRSLSTVSALGPGCTHGCASCGASVRSTAVSVRSTWPSGHRSASLTATPRRISYGTICGGNCGAFFAMTNR